MGSVHVHLTGPRFRAHVESIVEKSREMQEDPLEQEVECARRNDGRRRLKWLVAISVVLIVGAAAAVGQAVSTHGSQRLAALALEEQGRTEDAETVWQAIAKANPSDAEAYAHLGLLQAREQHYNDAIPNYRKALALNPRMPGLRLNLGLAYFKSGELRLAVSTFEPLLRAAPKGSPEALRLTTLIGLADYAAGDYASAVPYLKRATAADPKNLPFRMMLAHCCLWSKQYQCVLDVYHEILTLDPDSAEADMLAGEAYDELNNDSGALEEFAAAVKADPKMPEVHFGYGYLLWKALKFDDAEKEFRAELANDAQQPLALAYLGDVEIRQNRPAEALPHLEQAIRIRPSIPIAYLDLGTIDDGQGRKDDALRELKIAESLSPNDPTVHWHLGRLYQSIGQTAEAKAELKKTQTLQNAKTESLREQMNQVEPRAGVEQGSGGAVAPSH